MVIDLSQELMQATVQLEQPLGDGKRRVGAGFLISDPTPDGRPRTVLVTANHVLDTMPGQIAHIGYRVANPDGSWTYAPMNLRIRDGAGHELWTHHPVDYLASDDTFGKYQVRAGDEMMALGFPRGLSANQAGFPILRAGRVASFPIAPAKIFPTFLLDFAAFPGNSGGPVFMSDPSHRRAGRPGEAPQDVQFIAGLLTQQVELDNERLGIGVVIHASFIRETIARVSDPTAPVTEVAASQGAMSGARAASAEEAAAPE
jgi:hypothetical protein